MKMQQPAPAAGQIVLMGSGETAPSAQKMFHRVFAAIADAGDSVRMAILETPAGFEPNSQYVAEQIARFVQKRLQNFAPAITIVPARKRGTAFSPDDPLLAAMLHDANVIFMGPGSPTYAVRQMQDTVLWETVRACHRQGAALVFSSAASLAAGRWTLPIYEIYKAGADLYWQEGLNFFSDFGLNLILVPHWNNSDGGAVLDTSRCYLGQGRFGELLGMAQGGSSLYTIVGIDENTALALEPHRGLCTVVGMGGATVLREGKESVYTVGEQFAAAALGDFCLPASAEGIDAAVWQAVQAGRAAGAAARSAEPLPDEEVLALLAAREQARSAKNWQESDRLRDEIARGGWRVLDTGNGQKVERN
jgi:cyanophycinase-like exopeptidase